MARPRTRKFEGMEQERDKVLDRVMENYIKSKDVYATAGQRVKEDLAKMLLLMQERKITVYELDGYRAEIETKEPKVKVSKIEEDED